MDKEVSSIRYSKMLIEKLMKYINFASDKVYQLLVHGRWFSLGTPTSSTTKTGHHDIAEILLSVELNTNKMFNLASYFYLFRIKINLLKS
jgi:hypothetical protein